ncbi:DUF2800 domain-containing protein [uncultured Ruminobacter sp.]|uniref:DUF2800 domain-containing protein n=1 Tax=uncultured Ruminobacter sp. TaxID=538947 RepID=UPI002616051E|nr:DUF2800 domain-containing protein [uncultured Ruminobacter sp.]
MPDSHAILSASASHRWLMCPPSVRLSEQFPDDGGSEFAAEGTEAHELCEYRLKSAMGIPADDPVPHLQRYNEEMEDCACGYATHVLSLVEEAKQTCSDPKVLIEQRVDFSQWVPEGFGTADCIIVSDGTLRIVDYKHGLGVLVEAENNPQMKCYALGALEIFDVLYDIDTISMTIYQPRRENISTWVISREELLQWAENTLKPIAAMAFAGEGEFCSGEWCGFCKAKHNCRARAEANLMLAKHDFKMPELLEDFEIELILSKVDELASWANDVKEYALKQAVSGKEWHGWKLVEGRSVRKFTDDDKVIKTVSKAGFDPFEKKLLGITAMQKLLGRARFDELLSGLITKSKGKPTLVPDSDKRPEVSSAVLDFKDE